MRDDLRSLAEGLELNEGAPPDTIEAVQAALGVTFPEDLVSFLRDSNGAEGLIGDGYLNLFPVEELVELNEIPLMGLPNRRFVLFASDGGGESSVLDASADPPRILEIPDSIDPEDERPVGTSMADLLRYVRSGPDAH